MQAAKLGNVLRNDSSALPFVQATLAHFALQSMLKVFPIMWVQKPPGRFSTTLSPPTFGLKGANARRGLLGL
jgi:hypothetical protein